MGKKPKNKGWILARIVLICGFFVGLASFLNDSSGFIERYFLKKDRFEAIRKNFTELEYYPCKLPHEFSIEETQIGAEIFFLLFDSVKVIEDELLKVDFYPSAEEIIKSKNSLYSFEEIDTTEDLVCSLFSIADLSMDNKVFYYSTGRKKWCGRSCQPFISIVFLEIGGLTRFRIKNQIKFALKKGSYGSAPQLN